MENVTLDFNNNIVVHGELLQKGSFEQSFNVVDSHFLKEFIFTVKNFKHVYDAKLAIYNVFCGECKILN